MICPTILSVLGWLLVSEIMTMLCLGVALLYFLFKCIRALEVKRRGRINDERCSSKQTPSHWNVSVSLSLSLEFESRVCTTIVLTFFFLSLSNAFLLVLGKGKEVCFTITIRERWTLLCTCSCDPFWCKQIKFSSEVNTVIH